MTFVHQLRTRSKIQSRQFEDTNSSLGNPMLLIREHASENNFLITKMDIKK